MDIYILVFLLFILISLTSIFILDLIPKTIEWMQRIHIGKFYNLESWNNQLTQRGASWLINTPKVKVTDNSRLIIIDILKGNYTSENIQYWQQASLLLGLIEHLKYNSNQKIKTKILDTLDKIFDPSGEWKNEPKHIDCAILAYAVMKIDFIDNKKYTKAFDYTWKLIKDHKGIDGTVKYRKSMPDYRYVDTVGFICPFLINYGTIYKNEECIDLAVKQILEFEKYGMMDTFYIPSHVYKIDNKIPLGLYGWGRGLGWFAIGLIDSWTELPEGHKYRPLLENFVEKYAKSILYFQQENGSWNWTVARKETRPDSSTTATLAWYLLNAAKINKISTECVKGAEQALEYLLKVTRKNGAVDFSQGDTKDIGVYSNNFSILPFTQGFCIRSSNVYLNKTSKEKN